MQLGVAKKAFVAEMNVAISTHSDIVLAREKARAIAREIGFSIMSISLIVTAVSELAHNITKYAKCGRVLLKETAKGERRGLLINVSDRGPGIPDIEMAMREGYSTSRGLGLGLPGCRRLMDEFSIRSRVGRGTFITMIKWL